jgi:hypothetical protein
MPVPLFGLTLLLLAAQAKESVIWVRILSVVFLVWAAGLLVMAVFYGLTLPIAAKGFVLPDIGIGLKKAIAKTLLQLLVYPLVLLWMGVRGLKSARAATL